MRVPAEERVDRRFWLIDRDGERYFPIRIPRKGQSEACFFRVSEAGNTIEDSSELDDVEEVRDVVVNGSFSVRAVPESNIKSAPSLLKLNARKIVGYGPTGDGLVSDGPTFWGRLAQSVGREGAGWSTSAKNWVRPKQRGDHYVSCAYNTREGWVRIGLGVAGDTAEETYQSLLARRAAVERDAGEPLTWDTKEDRTKRQIFVKLPCDPNDPSDWSRQHAWLSARLPTFERLLERL